MVQQRYVVTAMSLSALFIGNAINANIPLVISKMALAPSLSHEAVINETMCPFPNSTSTRISETTQTTSANSTQANGEDRFDWSQELQGIILGAYYWAYSFTHFPGAILAQKFGGKSILLVAILMPALLSMSTPFAVSLGGANALIAVRALMGVFGGAVYPSLAAIFAVWFPPKERAFLCAVSYLGAALGLSFSTMVSGLLLHYIASWHSVFYFFGSLAIVWGIFFVILISDSPNSNRFISDDEREYLRKEAAHVKCPTNRAPIPWKSILSSPPVWALIIAAMCNDWNFFVVVLGVPKYLNDVLHFSIKENGFYSALPWICRLLVSLTFGRICDWLVSSKTLSMTNTRKLMIFLTVVTCGTFQFAAAYVGCDRILAVIFFTISVGGAGFVICSTLINQLDLSPNYASVIMSLSNGLGSFCGFFVPYVIGLLTPNSLLSEWRLVFWITIGSHFIKLAIYTIWGSGEIQPWDSPPQHPVQQSEECTKMIEIKNESQN